MLAALALYALGASAAGAQAPDGAPPAPGTPRQSYANPSAVIAAELAFARDVQVRGQWTAFAAAAAPEAVMFVPHMVWAQQWLKGRANPPVAVRWQPGEVWSSCDGTLMASHGSWQGARGQRGWFTTLWQRQPDGTYKWLLDHGDDLPPDAAAAADPDMIAAHVADCPPRPRRPVDVDGPGRRKPAKPPKPPKPIAPKDLPPLDPTGRAGGSSDGTLRWTVAAEPSGARTLTVTWTKDGESRPVLVDRVAGPAPKG